jgi:hypothetical protein
MRYHQLAIKALLSIDGKDLKGSIETGHTRGEAII